MAQPQIRDCIAQMPDSVLALLTKVNRADCIDFREAGMEAKVTNRLGGTTELSTLTDDYALWQYTSASQVEMKLLPLTDTTSVVCVVHTVQTPVADSRMAFYDAADGTPLPCSRFFSPTSDSSSLTFHSSLLRLSSDSLTLQAELHSEAYEPDGEGAVLVPSSTVTRYDWAESRFIPR